jgi:hypothetical protein
MKKITEKQMTIGLMLTPTCRNYSAKMAEEDLNKITEGYYHLDGYTRQYVILTKDNKAIVTQSTSKLNLRDMTIIALDLFLSCQEN